MHFISMKHQHSALQWPLQHLEWLFVSLKITKIQIGVKKRSSPHRKQPLKQNLETFPVSFGNVTLRSQTQSSAGAAFKPGLILAMRRKYKPGASFPLLFNLHCNNFRPRLWFLPFLAVFGLFMNYAHPWSSDKQLQHWGAHNNNKKNQIIPCVTTQIA